MGIFSCNNKFKAQDEVHVEADLSYDASQSSLVRIMTEEVMNEHMMFEAIIGNDFREVALVNEGAIDEVISLQEASIKDAISSIVKFLENLWSKISGFFTNFFKTVGAQLTADGQKLVSDYSKVVDPKDLSQMKFKYEEPNKPDCKIDVVLVDVRRYFDKNNVDQLRQKIEEVRSDDYKEELLGKLINKGKVSDKEFFSKAHEFFFSKEREVVGLDKKILSDIKETLSQFDKNLDKVKEVKKNIDKYYSQQIKDMKTITSQVEKSMSNDSKPYTTKVKDDQGHETDEMKLETNDSKVKYSLAIQLAKEEYNANSYAQLKCCSALIEAAKFNYKQARRIFIQAVSYNTKTASKDPEIQNNSAYIEAVGDMSDYEFDVMTEGFCY